VEWWHEGEGSKRNTFANNRFVGAETGIFVDVGGDHNRIVGNVFVGGTNPAIMLQGSSGNLVRDNVGCRMRAGSLVGFDTARWDDGRVARSRGNKLSGNTSAGSC
jgi:parallel beta-helix repeat protein